MCLFSYEVGIARLTLKYIVIKLYGVNLVYRVFKIYRIIFC